MIYVRNKKNQLKQLTSINADIAEVVHKSDSLNILLYKNESVIKV